MGCPDAVRAALLKVQGVLEVSYHPDKDWFAIRFESVLVKLEIIFAAVFTAGKMMGKEYFPELVTSWPNA